MAQTFDYATAMKQIAALEAFDGPNVDSACHSRAMTHGQQTENAIVLIHGMTNCPEQFSDFAPLLFDRGYNVLIPRQPNQRVAYVYPILLDLIVGQEQA